MTLDCADGSFDDISGETFLRSLLNMPIEAARWGAVSLPQYLLHAYLSFCHPHDKGCCAGEADELCAQLYWGRLPC